MTRFGVSFKVQNQWTDFGNFCIILMRNQCYLLCCKNLKIEESIHVTHLERHGHILLCDPFSQGGIHSLELVGTVGKDERYIRYVLHLTPRLQLTIYVC